jgi:hypothetical protein
MWEIKSRISILVGSVLALSIHPSYLSGPSGARALPLPGAVPAFAQANATGEWALTFTAPSGPMEFVMYIDQEGTKLSGHLTADTGEYPLTGTLEGNQIKITWSLPDRGAILAITLTGKIDGDSIVGTAKLGTLGEGPMSAERTAQ